MNKTTIKALLTALAFSATCAITACSTHPATTPNHVISISPLDKDHIKVEYQLLANSFELSEFYDERTPQLRANWKPLNNCGELINGKTLTQHQDCKSVSFSVPIEAKIIDRVNAIAYPMGEEGVLVHTATFAIKADNVTWQFLSPKGSVIIDGITTDKKTSIQQSKKNSIYYTGVFFSFQKNPPNSYVFAPASINSKLLSEIVDGSQQVSHYYQSTYPALSFLQPTLFINNIIQPDINGSQADVLSPRMIRFGFFNWQDNQLGSARTIAAHEFAHILQPKIETPPIVTEGGAEFIRWIAEYHMGWRDKNNLAENFSNMLQFCLDSAENHSWANIKNTKGKGGYTPYSCGLALHVIALASRQNTESAEQTLGNYYLNAKNYSSIDFAQAIECGTVNNCKPHFLPRLLDGDESIAEVFESQLSQLSLIKSKSYGEASSHQQFGTKAFSSLMIEDCAGTDIYTFQDHYKTGSMLTCKSLPSNVKITGVEGISYFKEPLKAIKAQNHGCSQKQQVTLSTLDNQLIKIGCTKTFTPQKNHYEIDIEKLLTLLDKH